MFLITGAKGQLGRCLAEILAGEQAYFCDVDEADITNAASLAAYCEGKNITALINCAAYTNVDKAEDEPEKAFAANVTGALNLAKLAAEKNIPLIHISTDYVFGSRPVTGILDETARTAPENVYGKTKLEGERAVMKYAPSCAIIRTAWLYSHYGNNFLKTMLRLGAEKSEIKVVADQIGTPTFAPDLARAVLAAARNLKPGAKEIYHFTNEGAASWYDFAYEIMRRKKLPCRVLPIRSAEYPAKAKRPFFSVLDKSKIKKDLGLEINHWTKGVEECLKRLS